MRPRGATALLPALAAALALAAAAAAQRPSASFDAPARVLALGQTGRQVVVAVGATRRQCPHVELWRAGSSTRVRFRSTLPACRDLPSTGQGIPAVAVATTRVLWLTYTGGNLRDWTLWTATPTRRTPRRLRFVERDVDAPAPIVLGPGTAAGVPYAVDREVVYLGDDGRARFRTTLAAPVRALAAHAHGRDGVVVAALLADGSVVGLDRSGR
ncbi:MAG TPA: hypothetical protein VNJ53_08615, partial [Gaiellaceae bacterium]|nr:hypothetical protein [Gaiellaceae bacterium]